MTIPSLDIAGSGVVISRLGFGCGRIFGGSELRASARLIEAALGAGIRHFDTAPSYGNGGSEAVLGTILAGVPDVTITTKVGIPRPDQPARSLPAQVLYRTMVRPLLSRLPATKARLVRMISGGGGATPDRGLPRRRLCRDEVVRALEESLKQLRRNRVDLYLVHEPNQFELTDDLRELFSTLQQNGMIGAFGLAWGGVADAGTAFGTVVQGRYASHPLTHAIAGKTKIFHGVLRHALHGPNERGSAIRVGIRTREVLDAHPGAGIIFSASTPGQIRDIASQCFGGNKAHG